MCDRERWLESRKNGELWARHANDIRATHALTFNPDYAYARSREAAQAVIQKVSLKLYKEADRALRASSRRGSVTQDADSLDFIGSYELWDKAGRLYPHCHLAITLRPGEDIKLHQFMLNRWGLMERCELTRRELIYVPAARPLFTHPRCRPEYKLKPVTGLSGWLEYAAKMSDEFTLPALPGEYLKRVA